MADYGSPLSPPLEVQQPERVARLPDAMPGGMIFQAKMDGWRCLAFVGEDEATIQARSGRIVTEHFPEILPDLATLPAGTVLDGEVCAVRDGVLDFPALASPPRARAAAGVAVSYIAFDILADSGKVVTQLPLIERWPILLALLDGGPAQVQPVLATLDRALAEQWAQALMPVGIEGTVVKDLGAPYRPGRGNGWVKVRHSDTVDADLLGAVGPEGAPTALRVRLEDGREVVTVNLEQRRLRQALDAVAEAGGIVRVEVRISGAGGRHEQVEFVRLRQDL